MLLRDLQILPGMQRRYNEKEAEPMIRLLVDIFLLPIKLMIWTVKAVFWILLIGIGLFL